MNVKEYLELHLSRVNQADYETLADGLDSLDTITPFERFAHLVGHFARIADLEFEQVLRGEWDWSPLGVAGFAYHRASCARTESDPPKTPIEYLEIAIAHAPQQAVPYFFRALWGKGILIFAKLGINDAPDFTMQDVVGDLEVACRLAPNWSEPRTELDRARCFDPDSIE